MKCPFCQSEASQVLESRDSTEGEVTRRRRECLKCSKRFTTYERVEGPALTVIKKDGSRETFDKEKLRRGIVRALEKRPVTGEKVEEIIDAVEREMLKKESGEVQSRMLGNAVLKRLKGVDKVAYVRFASVYLVFDAIDDFVRLVKRSEEHTS